MADLLASEYSWTHDYIFNSLTKTQVMRYLAAITARKQMQADVTDDNQPRYSANEEYVDIDKLKDFSALSDLNIVIQGG